MTAPSLSLDDTQPPEQLALARKELAKLPLLGPLTWLMARDPHGRCTTFADIDWRFLPPLFLDQCRLYNRFDLPWAFVTWARVSDTVDQRLRERPSSIEPHEWQSGTRLWLVDVLAPFGGAGDLLKLVLKDVEPGGTARAWIANAEGQLVLKEVRGHG